MNQTCLVTGGNGFIGSNLVHRLVKNRWNVHMLIRPQSNMWRIKDVKSNIFFHTISSEQDTSLGSIVNKIQPDHIFHLSSFGNNSLQIDPFEMIRTNIELTARLIEASKSIPYTSLLLTGSSSEYGFKTLPMSENDVLKPNSFYAATKAGMTHIAQVASMMYNKPIIIIRPFSVYGPFEDISRLIPTVIYKCLNNADVNLTDGREHHDFIFIDDFIDAFLQVADSPQQASGGILNIGSGVQCSTLDIVAMIHKKTKSRSRLLWNTYPSRSWDSDHWQADIAKMKKLYKWQPLHTLPQGIDKTISWMKENSYLYDSQ